MLLMLISLFVLADDVFVVAVDVTALADVFIVDIVADVTVYPG